MNTQLKKGSLELCVLCLLCGRDYYGFELVQAIPREIDMSEGTAYPLLKRMQEGGLVTTYWAESTAGPPRKYYRITPEGRRSFAALSAQWRTFSAAIDGLLRQTEPTPIGQEVLSHE